MQKTLFLLLTAAWMLTGCENNKPAPTNSDTTAPPKQEEGRAGDRNESSIRKDPVPDPNESIDGVYNYSGNDAVSEIIIMGNMWTGQFTFVSGFGAEYDAGNAEFQSGVVKGNDLYDESGYVKIGYVQGRTLTTTVGGQYLTLRKR